VRNFLGSVQCAGSPEQRGKTGKDVSDAKYLAERAQLTVCETDLKGAMIHCLPPCLFGKNGASVSALDAQKVGMQGCSSYVVWIGDGRDSYQDTLGDLLEAQTVNYLGIQNAPRKRRDSSLKPGAWIGGVVCTSDGRVVVTISEKSGRKC